MDPPGRLHPTVPPRIQEHLARPDRHPHIDGKPPLTLAPLRQGEA